MSGAAPGILHGLIVSVPSAGITVRKACQPGSRKVLPLRVQVHRHLSHLISVISQACCFVCASCCMPVCSSPVQSTNRCLGRRVMREHGVKVLTVRDILSYGVEDHVGARVELEDLAMKVRVPPLV